MFAVVQIGSSTRKSACITALTVRARDGCARVLRMEGALVSAAAARPPFRMFLRVVMVMPPTGSALHKLGHADAWDTSMAVIPAEPTGRAQRSLLPAPR